MRQYILHKACLIGIAWAVLLSGAALAQQQYPLLDPNQPTPLLGFYGQQSYGGIYVVSVTPNSLASSIGLEPGDVIVRVNGERMWSLSAYHAALQRAANSGGQVSLVIRNWRTGLNERRYVQLYQNPPPVLLYQDE